MRKSELKEIIKSAMLEEANDSKKGNSEEQKRMEGAIKDDRDHIKDLEKDIKDNEEKLSKLKKDFKDDVNEEKVDEGSKYYEDKVDEAEEVDVEDDENVDIDIEKDVEIDDESVESDIEVKGSMPGESADEVAIQSLLMKAQEEASKLGDEKLTDQIGNTITYFTRAHVAQVDESGVNEEEDYNSDVADISIDNPAEDAVVGLDESISRFKKLAGIIK